jgi:hypothetical protein
MRDRISDKIVGDALGKIFWFRAVGEAGEGQDDDES